MCLGGLVGKGARSKQQLGAIEAASLASGKERSDAVWCRSLYDRTDLFRASKGLADHVCTKRCDEEKCGEMEFQSPTHQKRLIDLLSLLVSTGDTPVHCLQSHTPIRHFGRSVAGGCMQY